MKNANNIAKFYPRNFKIYSHSRQGIMIPQPTIMSHAEMLLLVENLHYVRTSHKTVGIFSEDENLLNAITYERFERS